MDAKVNGRAGRATLDRQKEELLRRVWLFQQLTDEQVTHLLGFSRWTRCARGTCLDCSGVTPVVVHAIVEGAARAVRQITDSEPVTVAELRTGDIWGLSMFAPGLARHSVLEVVSERAMVVAFPAPMIASLFHSENELVWTLVECLFDRLEHAHTRIAQLAALSVEQRTAQILAEKALQSPDGYVADRHAQLAAVVGTNRTGITRCLTTLRKRHLIAHDPLRRGIVVPDVQRLVDQFQLDGAF